MSQNSIQGLSGRFAREAENVGYIPRVETGLRYNVLLLAGFVGAGKVYTF